MGWCRRFRRVRSLANRILRSGTGSLDLQFIAGDARERVGGRPLRLAAAHGIGRGEMGTQAGANGTRGRGVGVAGPLFEGQLLHLLLLVALLSPVALLSTAPAVASGELWGWSASTWLWITVGTAILHQGYVWLCWRLELHARALSRTFPGTGFRLFKAGFGILGLSRWAIVPLAVANRGTLELPAIAQWGVSALFLLLSGYLFYSVLRYFGIDRGVGLDHFDARAQEWPLVREGIFRFSFNAMYTFGFLALWVPGLVLESAAAVLAAAFQHAYIWVHFHCTEGPDMERIYGGGTEG